MRGILWKGDWPAEHHEEKNGKMCFETFFCVWLIGIEKWHWGAKKQVRTVKYMLSQSGKKYQKILIDFSTFLYMKNETIFVEFPPLCFDDFYLLIVASRRATCNKTLPVRIFLNTEIASAWDIPWRAKPLTAKISSPIKRKSIYNRILKKNILHSSHFLLLLRDGKMIITTMVLFLSQGHLLINGSLIVS